MDRKLILDFDRQQKKQKQQKLKHGNKDTSTRKVKRAKLHEDQDEPSQPTTSANYRDRAKERREGLNKDFELDPDDLKISNPVAEAGEAMDEAELKRRQIEESKYLGGDIEHTHLVKGLDFALLEKNKSAMKLEAENHSTNDKSYRIADSDLILADSDSDEEALTREAIKAATATSSGKRQIDIEKLRRSEMVQCRTAMARRILNALDEDTWPVKSDLFQPGRMSYVFCLDTELDTQVTTILRSKAEQANYDAPVSEKDLAFDQLINIFAKISNQKSVK